MITNYTAKVKEIIFNHNSGWVFTHVDFNSLGNMATVERVLSRMVMSGEIKRIRRGIYYIPENSRWGEVPPSQSNIIKALSRSMNTNFIPDGANALYQLGLTQQVPMKQVYLTDKQISTISIGKTDIEFKKVSPKKLSGASSGASVYLSAIEYLGAEALQESVKSRVANTIDKSMVAKLEEASELRAVWVREVVKDITGRVA
jgi:predicted transcriptional regulator of viral defense system